jgi:hypothetical protein
MKRKPRPNLFLIGAMKSGSTSLHYYLSTHPQIFMCEPKEPFYFTKEINWSKGEDWYIKLFEHAYNAKIIGESSTAYAKRPKYSGVTKRIAEFNPKARFIYIMRDPIERTISHYWHSVRWHGEKRDMLSAIKGESHFLDVSNYPMQLAPYFKIFGHQAVYSLTFEQLVDDPISVVSAIYSWLGVDPSFTPPNIRQKENITPARVEQIKGLGILHRFRYSKVWNRLHPLFPTFLINLGRYAAVKDVNRSSVRMNKVIDYLRPILIQNTEDLRIMLDRSFPEWSTLYGTES